MEKCNIYNCNIYDSQKYIKHKWIPIIIYLIEKRKKIQFSELLNNIEYISNKRLSESLKLLLNEMILYKENNYYFLSEKGEKLADIITLMSKFYNEEK